MKKSKRWYEYKQPKRRIKAFEEENKDSIVFLRESANEILDINEKLFYSKSFVWKNWEEFMKNE